MDQLEKVNLALSKLIDFIQPHLPFANTPMVNFITQDFWNAYLPKDIQADLLSLSEEQIKLLPTANLSEKGDDPLELRSLNKFMNEAKSCHLDELGLLTDLQYVLSKHGKPSEKSLHMKKTMPEKKQHEVELLSSLAAGLSKGQDINWIIDLGSGLGYLSTSLSLFYQLNVLGIDASTSNAENSIKRINRLQKHYKNLYKKENNSEPGEVIAPIGEFYSISKFIDGKQDVLELLHENIIQSNNIENILTLKEETESVMIAENNQNNSSDEKTEKSNWNLEENSTKDLKSCSQFQQSNVNSNSCSDSIECNGINTKLISNKLDDSMKDITSNNTLGNDDNMVERYFSDLRTEKTKPTSQKCLTNLHLQSLQFKSKNTESNINCQDELQTNLNSLHLKDENNENNKFNAILHLKDENNKFNTIQNDLNIGLVGLHTCGNLASTSLDLFINNSSIKFICNVGCCYNFLGEMFDTDVDIDPKRKLNLNESEYLIKKKLNSTENAKTDSIQNVNADNFSFNDLKKNSENTENCGKSFTKSDHPAINGLNLIGFPMSDHLKKLKFCLGRNARMMSNQSAERLSISNDDSTTLLYWRALLEKFLRDKCESLPKTAVGRLRKTPNTFKEYCKQAFKRLDLNMDVEDAELDAYDKDHQEEKEKIKRFYYFRASLAPVIEGIILLDRLAYLLQHCTNSYLIKLFDAETSPRCYSLTSVKGPI